MRIPQYEPELIVDDVVPLYEADYEAGTEEFVDRFLAVASFPAGFYRFGEISSPGVSHVDLLIVCRDQDWKRAWQIAREVGASSERPRYLFAHPALVLGASLLPELPVVAGQDPDRLAPWDTRRACTRGDPDQRS